MAMTDINGVRLSYAINGTGETPLVLVHGSWASRRIWDSILPRLADSFRLLTYDRRGHGESERPSRQGSVREDVADLAALTEHLGLAPAWVAGNSFGASITLRLAGERPDLLRGIMVHEPPLFSLLASDAAVAPMLEAMGQRIEAVAQRIASGDHAGAAEQFIEEAVLGPGMWAKLPLWFQQMMIENAPTFLDEANDPEALTFELEWIREFSRPALLTGGDQSPPAFASVISKVAEALPAADVTKFREAGHVPHMAQPEAYVEAITGFAHKHHPSAPAVGSAK